MNLPIRVRLMMWYAALLAVIIIGLGVFIVLQLKADLRETMDVEVRTSTATIINAFQDRPGEVPSQARKDLTEDVNDFTRASSIVLPRSSGASQLLGSEGEVLARYGSAAGTVSLISPQVRSAAAAGKSATFTAQLGKDGQSYLVRATALSSNDKTAVLVVALSLNRVEDAVWRVVALLLVAGPAALGASALAAYWLANTALHPVRRMTLDAQRIGADRLDERIAVPVAQDEIGNLAITLNAMLERIEQGATRQRQLVADASHELRTPLAVMRAEIDVSLRADELPPSARDVLCSAREEVDHMSRTVDNLLTLAAADEGRLGLLAVQVNLREVIERAVQPLRALAASKGMALLVEGGPWEARADPKRLQLAVTNLVENALHFTPAGGQVRILSWHRNGVVGVTVRDDGPGISAQDCEHLFDRFYRVDTARGRDFGGSGLGLAICREVALAHGGKAWVESDLGRGSAFFLELPSWNARQVDPASLGQVPVRVETATADRAHGDD